MVLVLMAATAVPAAQGAAVFRAGSGRAGGEQTGDSFEINEVLSSGASSLRHVFGSPSSGLAARGSSYLVLLGRAAADTEANPLAVILFFVVYVALVVLAAKYYLGKREAAYTAPLDEEAKPEDFKAFRAGVLECHQRPDICLWSLCCPWVRWGDSMWTMGLFKTFWLPMVLYFVLVSFEALGVVLFLALVCALYRQELRKKFEMARQGGITYLEDFCLYFWCSCCMVAQEARHVEEAARAEHPAVVRKAAAAREGAEP